MHDRVEQYSGYRHHRGGRLGRRLQEKGTNICCALIMGPLFIVGSLVLMVWNEKNSLDMHRSLNEAIQQTLELSSVDQIDGENEGRMVHAEGRAISSQDHIEDTSFGVYADHSLKLRRQAEMYQWQERTHTETRHHYNDDSDDRVTVYDYDTVWSSQVIDSTHFEYQYGHQNPNYMTYDSESWESSPITFGSFLLSPEVVSKLSWYQSYALNDVHLESSPDLTIRTQGNLRGSRVYLGNPQWPRVGDQRFQWERVPFSTVSICAVQVGDSFAPYRARKGGKKILLVERGRHSTEELYENAHSVTTRFAILWRLLGFAALWAGLGLILAPVNIVAESIPCLGSCLGGLVGCLATTITFVLAAVVSASVIGTAWVAYRVQSTILDNLIWILPLTLLLLGLCGFWVLYERDKKQQDASTAGDFPDHYEEVPMSSAPMPEPEISVPAMPVPMTPPGDKNDSIPYAEAIPLVETVDLSYGSVAGSSTVYSTATSSSEATSVPPSAPPAYMDDT